MTALYDTAPPSPAQGRLAAIKAKAMSAASTALLPALRRIAGDRIGGETLDDAWRVARAHEAAGLAHTLGFWDTPAYSPPEVVAIYRAAIDRIGAGGADSYLSIKPPALRFAPLAARELAQAAQNANVRLHCDSHGIDVADLTLGFTESLLDRLPAHLVSVTAPGRWARSPDDTRAMMNRGIGVRIVKGQWPDPADAARDPRAGFLAVVDVAAAGGAKIAIATHDADLLAGSADRLVRAEAAFEAEFIHGLQTPGLLRLADEVAAPARIYVPYGRGFVPSALGVLKRNPRLALGLLKQMVGRRA